MSSLVRMVEALMEVSCRWDCRVRCTIEPDGNACETGHFVDLEIEQYAVWADMSPWPARFGGAIPDRLDAELELAGWVLRREGADPDPLDCVCKMPELWSDDQRESAQLPARRLVAFGDTDDLGSWASRLVHAIERILAPSSSRWYLSCGADALQGGRLADHPGSQRGEFFGRWSVDLGDVLASGDWERAVWPLDSESALLVCAMGLHQYHERPCPAPPHVCGMTDPDGDDEDVW